MTDMTDSKQTNKQRACVGHRAVAAHERLRSPKVHRAVQQQQYNTARAAPQLSCSRSLGRRLSRSHGAARRRSWPAQNYRLCAGRILQVVSCMVYACVGSLACLYRFYVVCHVVFTLHAAPARHPVRLHGHRLHELKVQHPAL